MVEKKKKKKMVEKQKKERKMVVLSFSPSQTDPRTALPSHNIMN
jgi:hypothetical protein